ncbi:MAG: hypothetical protein D6732_28480 [Methanobacteriota archaeon]|nr:MAG: hypothetical protein D6732_28480 [Euryarchaeota archaeon]
MYSGEPSQYHSKANITNMIKQQNKNHQSESLRSGETRCEPAGSTTVKPNKITEKEMAKSRTRTIIH